MDLTPGERAILNQLKELYSKASKRDYHLTAITSQWPPIHYDAYRSVLIALADKNLIRCDQETQWLRITDLGLRAIGAAVPQAGEITKTIKLAAGPGTTQARPATHAATAKSHQRPDRHKGFTLAASAAGYLAILACAAWMLSHA